MKQFWNWIIILVSLLAIFGTLGLVQNEFINGDICPKLLGTPACYIVLVCFTIGLISHLIKVKYANTIFFIFIGLVTSIALTGTFGEILGFTKCPRTSGGVPMCFISLGICLSLLVGKLILVRRKD